MKLHKIQKFLLLLGLVVVGGGTLLVLGLMFVQYYPFFFALTNLFQNNLLLSLVVSSITILVIYLVWKGYLFVVAEPILKCNVCGADTLELLTSGKQSTPYCRKHLIEKFSKKFLGSNYWRVMVEFQPEATYYTGQVYGYYPLSEMKRKGWGDDHISIVKDLISTTKTRKCEKCHVSALVLFVNKVNGAWSKYAETPSTEFRTTGEFYCNKHALEKVLPSIKNNRHKFKSAGGLYVPYKEDGFQVTTQAMDMGTGFRITNYQLMKVYLGADHRGFELKEKVKMWLEKRDIAHEDMGAYKLDPHDDYTLYAEKVALVVANEKYARGILICGSGVGVDVAANKFDGVRASIGKEPKQVEAGRRDDDMNVLVIAADFTEEKDALEMVQVFLQTEFSGLARHERRLEEIKRIEENN